MTDDAKHVSEAVDVARLGLKHDPTATYSSQFIRELLAAYYAEKARADVLAEDFVALRKAIGTADNDDLSTIDWIHRLKERIAELEKEIERAKQCPRGWWIAWDGTECQGFVNPLAETKEDG